MIRITIYILMIISMAIFILMCNHQGEEVVSTEQSQKQYPTSEGWDSEIRITKIGKLQSLVHYGHMLHYENSKTYYFNDSVIVDFFDDMGEHISHLTADRGRYHEDTQDVYGMGHVVVVSDTGVTLKTEQLRWDRQREKIISDTTVMVITENNDTLYGHGLESNPDLSRIVIKEPWGISERRVDIEKLEASLTEQASSDTTMVKDSTEVME